MNGERLLAEPPDQPPMIVPKPGDSSASDENLSRQGRGRTKKPRVYVGCLPCAKGRFVADIEHANRWLEGHWPRCSSTETLSPCKTPQRPSEVAA